MSNSEASAIVLQGSLCMCGIIQASILMKKTAGSSRRDLQTFADRLPRSGLFQLPLCSQQ